MSPTSSTSSEHETKRPNTMDYSGHDKIPTGKPAISETPSSADQDSSINTAENNKVLQQALGPLVTEFKLLRESVDSTL